VQRIRRRRAFACVGMSDSNMIYLSLGMELRQGQARIPRNLSVRYKH
jgi:hypothetical protein